MTNEQWNTTLYKQMFTETGAVPGLAAGPAATGNFEPGL